MNASGGFRPAWLLKTWGAFWIGRCLGRLFSKNSRDGSDEPPRTLVKILPIQIGALNRGERAATANITIRYVALIKPDWDKPRLVRAAQTQLLDRQCEFFVLITFVTPKARLGETGEEHQCIAGDRMPDFRAPVFPRPKVGRIPPHRDTGSLEHPLQPVDLA